jgi:calcium-dependent protein kinase
MGCTPSSRKVRLDGNKHDIDSKASIKPSAFVAENTNRLTDVYKLGKLLGSGAYADVRICYLKENGAKRAVKIIKKQSLSGNNIRQKIDNEKEIIKSLDHPNIIRFYEFFEDAKKLYIIMEHSSGFEFFSQILQNESYSEIQAAKIMYQIFSVLSYLHEKNIAHRDFKPESILMDKDTLKVIDFTEACIINTRMSQKVGTLFYSAPEVIFGTHTISCDLWSAGVIFYILLTGCHPFSGINDEETLENIKNIKYTTSGKVWNSISTLAKELISLLLCEQSRRISSIDALHHPWIQNFTQIASPETPIMASALNNLRHFRNTSVLRDAVHLFLTMQRVSTGDIKTLGEVFKKIDKNGDGKLSKQELISEYTSTLGIIQAESEVEKIMKEVDTNNDGFINYTEFLKAALDTRKILSIENLRAAFRNFDKDFSGRISVLELKRVVSERNLLSNKTWTQILKEVDLNGDGEIDLEEFEKLVLTKGQEEIEQNPE